MDAGSWSVNVDRIVQFYTTKLVDYGFLYNVKTTESRGDIAVNVLVESFTRDELVEMVMEEQNKRFPFKSNFSSLDSRALAVLYVSHQETLPEKVEKLYFRRCLLDVSDEERKRWLYELDGEYDIKTWIRFVQEVSNYLHECEETITGELYTLLKPYHVLNNKCRPKTMFKEDDEFSDKFDVKMHQVSPKDRKKWVKAFNEFVEENVDPEIAEPFAKKR